MPEFRRRLAPSAALGNARVPGVRGQQHVVQYGRRCLRHLEYHSFPTHRANTTLAVDACQLSVYQSREESNQHRSSQVSFAFLSNSHGPSPSTPPQQKISALRAPAGEQWTRPTPRAPRPPEVSAALLIELAGIAEGQGGVASEISPR